jgi:hypothetical protein
MRWPVNIQCSREFATLFYQELADGMSLGEAMRRTRSVMAQRHTEDFSWMSYVLYGDPTITLVFSSPGSRDRAMEFPFDDLDDDQMLQPMFSFKRADRAFAGGIGCAHGSAAYAGLSWYSHLFSSYQT